jgi:hypothetical protein
VRWYLYCNFSLKQKYLSYLLYLSLYTVVIPLLSPLTCYGVTFTFSSHVFISLRWSSGRYPGCLSHRFQWWARKCTILNVGSVLQSARYFPTRKTAYPPSCNWYHIRYKILTLSEKYHQLYNAFSYPYCWFPVTRKIMHTIKIYTNALHIPSQSTALEANAAQGLPFSGFKSQLKNEDVIMCWLIGNSAVSLEN